MKKQRVSESRELLGSRVTLTVCARPDEREQARAALAAAFAECTRIEQQFSRFLPQSELSRLNARLDEDVPVSAELYLLLAFAEQIRALTGGAFDITVQSILAGWGYDAGYSLREGAPGSTGMISLDRERQSARLTAPIDLGALGKGYALDRMLPCFADFSDVLLDAGGDIYARGTDEQAKPWRLVFEHPTDTGRAIGEVAVQDGLFLAASSPSRRAWRDRHHLVQPQRQAPAQDMLMAYVQASQGMVADALSTALFVLGWERAQRLLPQLDAEAMLVGPQGKIYRTAGFAGELYLG